MVYQDNQSHARPKMKTALQHAHLERSVKLVLGDVEEGAVVISKCYTASSVLQTIPAPARQSDVKHRDSTSAWSLKTWQPLRSVKLPFEIHVDAEPFVCCAYVTEPNVHLIDQKQLQFTYRHAMCTCVSNKTVSQCSTAAGMCMHLDRCLEQLLAGCKLLDMQSILLPSRCVHSVGNPLVVRGGFHPMCHVEVVAL